MLNTIISVPSLRHLFQDGSPPPPALGLIGPLNIRASLEGSHVSPHTSVQWLVPGTSFSGQAAFGPETINIAAAGGGWDMAARADVTNPNALMAREANTQVSLFRGGGLSAVRLGGVEQQGQDLSENTLLVLGYTVIDSW